MNFQEVIKCPQCGGNKVKSAEAVAKGLMWFGVFSCITIIGIPLGIILLLASWYVKKSKMKLTFRCQECKHDFKVNENTYNNYNNELAASTVVTTHSTPQPIRIQPGPIKQDEKNTLSFNVAGVTFDNDKGKDIQKLLRQIAKHFANEQGAPAYDGYSNKEIIEYNTEVSEFEGIDFGDNISFEKDPNNEHDKKAIKVFVNLDDQQHHVGYVPKKERDKVNELLDSENIKEIGASFVGGKVKEVDYDFEKEKEIVVVKELTQGVEITLYLKG